MTPDPSSSSSAPPADTQAARRSRTCLFAGLPHALVRFAGLADFAARPRWWVPGALALGTGPFLACWALGTESVHAVPGILLALVCLACVRRGARRRAMGMIVLAFLSHCVLVIAMTAAWPARAKTVLPEGDWYWHKQIHWIRTGEDPEYQLSNWVPAHAILLGGVLIYSASSFGAITFWQGFRQVDMMNYYNAKLLVISWSRPTALLLGWHVWSILRGVGYLFLTLETVWVVFHLLSGRPEGRRVFRWKCWAAGLAFVLADALVKLTCMPAIRDAMQANLK